MPGLDNYTLTEAKKQFIQALKDENLLLIPAEYGSHVYDLIAKQNTLLKQKAVSAYKVAQYKLIPGASTIRTVKNMVEDGRISDLECYSDDKGVLLIMTNAIKRLRDGK